MLFKFLYKKTKNDHEFQYIIVLFKKNNKQINK